MKPWAPSQDKQQDIGRQTLHLVVSVSTRLLQHFHWYLGGESLQAGKLSWISLAEKVIFCDTNLAKSKTNEWNVR